jgi:phospholipid/cholesterol/gamma-HCH transport system substrate-binding protein
MQKEIELREGVKFTPPVAVPAEQGAPPSPPPPVFYKNGATLNKRQASLLGDYYLEITPGLEGKVIAEGGQIYNVPQAAGLDKMFDRLNIIADDISKVTRSLAQTFGSEEGQAALSRILKSLEAIVLRLNNFFDDNAEHLDNVVANADTITSDVKLMTGEVRGDLKQILGDARQITRETRYLISQSGSDVQEGLGTFKNTLTRLETTLEYLNYTLQNTGEITDKINEGDGTLGVLVNDPAIAQETERTLKSVGGFVERIVELKTIVELRSEYLVRQSALKNYVALRLQPADDKFYLIEIVDDPRGRTSVTQRTKLQTDPSLPPVVREDETLTVDSFKFSVMLAKRWNFATGRFGILESSGGVGVDLHFLDDSLEFKFDLFDFGEDVNPRLRTSMAYSFFQHFYIVAGADDILNDTTRDVFFGGFLRFNDQDLLTILASSPSISTQ